MDNRGFAHMRPPNQPVQLGESLTHPRIPAPFSRLCWPVLTLGARI
jgi:hypothetical protein